MPFDFLLTDRAGRLLAELQQATGRGLKLPIKGLPVARFTIDRTNPLVPYVLMRDRTLLKIYDRDADTDARTLRFQGPIVSYQKVVGAQSGTIAVTAVGLGWLLQKRLLGKTVAGYTDATAASPVDKARLAGNMIAAVNADQDTGIRVVATNTAGGRGYVSGLVLKPALAAISELAATADGFDYRIAPLEPGADGKLGEFQAAPVFGTPNMNAVWEFGTGRHNVDSWTDNGSSEGLLNSGWIPPGGTTTAPQSLLNIQDAQSIADHGLMEDTVTTDLSVEALARQLLQEHVTVRGDGQRTITFTPTVDPGLVYGRHFVEGDIVPFHAIERFPIIDPATGSTVGEQEVSTADGLFRIYNVDLSIDELGQATPAITLVATD